MPQVRGALEDGPLARASLDVARDALSPGRRAERGQGKYWPGEAEPVGLIGTEPRAAVAGRGGGLLH